MKTSVPLCIDLDGTLLNSDLLLESAFTQFKETPLSALHWPRWLAEGKANLKAKIAERVLKEINERLGFLNNVGVGYLTLSRSAGTLSGAPKVESMKIIERVEKSPRGPYGGAVGHFGWNGDCTFAIPIRTLFVNENRAFARASGGIVFDSDPEYEYREIENKLAAIVRTLQRFEAGSTDASETSRTGGSK